MRSLREARNKPLGCRGYLLYNEFTLEVVHDIMDKEVARKLSVLWDQGFITRKNAELDRITLLVEEESDGVYQYCVSHEWYIVLCVDDVDLLDDAVKTLMKGM